MKIQELINKIESQKNRSKWSQGVAVYSLMMLEELQEQTDEISKDIKYYELEKNAITWCRKLEKIFMGWRGSYI